jgi:hypothetical protein
MFKVEFIEPGERKVFWKSLINNTLSAIMNQYQWRKFINSLQEERGLILWQY